MKENSSAVLAYFSGRQVVAPVKLPAPPASVLALGISSVVIGGLGVLLSLLAADTFMNDSAYSRFSGPLPVPASVSATACGAIAAAEVVLSALSAMCSLLLVRAGVSVLRREFAALRRYRLWAICWCAVAIPFVASIVLDYFARAEICVAQGGYMLRDGVRIGGAELLATMRWDAYLLGLCTLGYWMAYPLVVLILLRRRSARVYYGV